MRSSFPAAIAAASLLFASSAAFADSPPGAASNGPFTVRLSHPDHVGDVELFRLETSTSRSQRISGNRQPARSRQSYREVRCVLLARVLAVSADSTTIHGKVDVRSMVGRTVPNAAFASLQLDGISLDARLRPNITITRSDGKALSADQRAYLDLVFRNAYASADSHDTDDGVFGPLRPVRIGDTWTANVKRITASLSRGGVLPRSMNHITSLISLKARKHVDGIDCLVVRGVVDSGRIEWAGDKTTHMHDVSGKAHTEISKTVPVDPTKHPVAASTSIEMTYAGKLDLAGGGVADISGADSDFYAVTELPFDTK